MNWNQKQIPQDELHSSEGTSGSQGFDVVTKFFEKTHASWCYQWIEQPRKLAKDRQKNGQSCKLMTLDVW